MDSRDNVTVVCSPVLRSWRTYRYFTMTEQTHQMNELLQKSISDDEESIHNTLSERLVSLFALTIVWFPTIKAAMHCQYSSKMHLLNSIPSGDN